MEKRFVKINTTAYSEEDFLLLTDLTDEQIEAVITPIVERERNGGEAYDNFELHSVLSVAYPNNLIEFYTEEFDTISI